MTAWPKQKVGAAAGAAAAEDGARAVAEVAAATLGVATDCRMVVAEGAAGAGHRAEGHA